MGAGPGLLNGLGDVISGGKELYNKIYNALEGSSSDSDYGTSSGSYYGSGGSYDEGDFTDFSSFVSYNTNNNQTYNDGPRTEPDIYSESIAITCNVDPKIYCHKGVIKVVSRSNVKFSNAKEIVDKYVKDRVNFGFKIKRFEYDEHKEEIYVTLTKPGVKLVHTFDVI